MEKNKLAKNFLAIVETQPESEFWLQIFKAFIDCSIDAEVTKYFNSESQIFRRGVALTLKTPNFNHFGFLCQNYSNLCTFIEAYAKYLSLSLPEFIIINSPEGSKKLFIVRRTREAKLNEEGLPPFSGFQPRVKNLNNPKSKQPRLK